MLASHLGMPLRECIEKHTHREYLMWMAYLEEDWKAPNLTDYYLMQIAQEVRRVLSKKPNRIKLDHFLLKFQTEKEQIRERTKDSKSTWMQILGMVKKRNGS